MKKFATLIIAFSLPVIALLIAFELSLRHIPNDYTYKRRYLDTKSNEVEVLYLGNSHIFYGINPEYSNFKSFNSAHIFQTLNYDLAIVEKYKDNWSNLKCIVVPIDYFSMYMTLETSVEKWRVKNYNIYYDLKPIDNNEGHFELSTGKFSANVNRLCDYYRDGKNDVTCNKLGWGKSCNSKKGDDLIETGKTAAERHTVKILDGGCFEKNLKDLETIIEFARKRNVKVILITCPAYHSYVSLLNQKQLDHTLSLMKKLASEKTNIAYYNLLNDKSYVAGDFYDADHFNEIGAKKFTLQLNNIINRLNH